MCFKMSDKNRVIKAGIGYTVGNYLLKGLSFITMPIFTRLMSTSNYGLYNTYLSYEAFLFMIVGFSFHASLKNAKYKFNDKFNQYISSIILIQLVSLFIWFILLNGFYPLYGERLGYSRILLNLLLVYCFATALIQVYNAYLGLEYKYSSFLKISAFNAIANIVVSIGLILTICQKYAYVGRIVGTVFPAFLIAMYIIVILWRNSAPVFNRSFAKFAFSYSIPIIPHGLSQVVLSQFDRIMINSMVGSMQAGIYSFSYNIYSIVFVTTSSTDQVWGPWFYEKMNEKNEKEITKKAQYYSLFIALIVIIVVLIAPELIIILGSKAYKESVYTVVPIVASGFFAFLYTLPVQVEYYFSKTKLIAMATSCAAVINVVLNYFCINHFGYIAAAYTTLFTYILYFCFHLFISYKIVGHLIFSLKSIIVCSLMVLISAVIALITLRFPVIRWGFVVLIVVFTGIYVNKVFGINRIYSYVNKKILKRNNEDS